MQDFPEITEQELIDNLEAEDFFARFGNPVRIKSVDDQYVIMSYALYRRLGGKENPSEPATTDSQTFAVLTSDFPKTS